MPIREYMEKVTPKYFILPRSITVIIGDKNYHISDDNIRYREAVTAIDKNELDELAMIVDPTLRLGDANFSVVDGLVCYRQELLPSVLGDQFLKYKVESVSFLSLVNFWMNLKTRVDFEKAKEKVVSMLSMNAYPLTKDGFIIVYRGDDFNWYNKPMNDDVQIPFYSYASCRPSVKSQLEERKSLEQICIKELGFFTKKLNKLVLEKVLDKKNLKLDDSVFKYGIVFKDILSAENLVTFIEKEVFFSQISNLGEDNAQSLNELLKCFTEKKVMNFFTKFKNKEEEAQVKAAISQAGNAYLALKNAGVNIETHRFQNFTELFTYMQEEAYKLRFPLFDLNIEKNFPQINNILSMKINKDLELIVPKTSRELHVWSHEMSNCIGGYDKRVSQGGTLVLGVKGKEGELLYNIEINDFKIRQFVKKHNSPATKEEQSPILKFFKKHGLLK